MARRKSGRKTVLDKAVSAAEAFISELKLKALCPRKLFDIVFISSQDEESFLAVEEISGICKEYEDVASTTFVNYKDVLQCLNGDMETNLPPPFPTHIKVIFEKAQRMLEEHEKLSPTVMAQLTKIQLVEVMYKNYLLEQEIQQRKIKLENDLRLLTKECIKRTKSPPSPKKGQMLKKSDTKLSVGLSENNLFGCPPVDEEQLVFDDDVKNHVWLYIIYGCTDMEVFRLLISSFNVPISAVLTVKILSGMQWDLDPTHSEISETDSATIIKLYNIQHTSESLLTNLSKSLLLSHPKIKSKNTIDDAEDTEFDIEEASVVNKISTTENVFLVSAGDSHCSTIDPYLIFNETIGDAFYGPDRLRSLENTVLMHFDSKGNDYKRLLEELLFVVKNILYLKFQHLHYIRHISLHEIKRQYDCLALHCFRTYYKIIESIPSEYVNEAIVFTSLLEDIDVKLDDSIKRISSLEKLFANKSDIFILEKKCKKPFDFEQTLQDQEFLQTFPETMPRKNYTIHENNLDMSDQKVAVLVNGLIKNMRKDATCLRLVKHSFESRDFSHKHDRDPSTVTEYKLTENIVHMLHLFLFSLFTHRQKKYKDSNVFRGDLLEHLSLYNSYEFFRESQIKYSSSHKRLENLYDTSIGAFRWKENLASGALVKEVAQAENSYLYVKESYCSETESYLFLFSDHLDEFGINTEIFEETLSTPICLRDFCKYTLIEKFEWLQHHQPPRYKRKVEKLEECPGFKKIVALNLFPEYRCLLQTESECEANKQNEKENEQESDIEFSDILNEIEKYPPNVKLITEFNKLTPEILAFDLGTQYTAIRGSRTTFVSHDGVKIIVDNTRFIDEKPQCSFNVNCRNNQLVFYSHPYFQNNTFNFHTNLSDGTIVTFMLEKEDEKEPSRRNRYSSAFEDIVPEVPKTNVTVTQPVMKTTEIIEEVTDILETIKVTCINREEFEKNTNTEIPSLDSKTDIDDLLLTLHNIEDDTSKVYKIINNLKYLNLNSDMQIPLTNLLRRILPPTTVKTVEQLEKPTMVKKYMSTEKPPTVKKPPNLDFQITTPNNLFVSSYMSEVTRIPVIEIKQEYLRTETVLTRIEEFRLFTRKGYIVVKRTDGTIIIMESNGDQVHFEKPDTSDEDIRRSNLKQCHCRDINDYRNKVNQVLAHNDELYFASRRGHRHTKKGYAIDKTILEMLQAFKVPYRKVTLLKVDGNRTSVEGSKIIKKHVYFTTCEHDFSSEEMYFERSDGMQCLYDKYGKRTVMFADGTKIINIASVEPDLVDGFVYVNTEIQFQHPDYADVIYHLDSSFSVKHKNFEVTRNQENQITFNIDSDIKTVFERELVTFSKTCPNCQESYRCTFNLRPYARKSMDLNEQFLHAEDSYNKHFISDFKGSCRRNSAYINDAFNRANCNHVDNKVYKRLFVVNKNYTGSQFWTPTMIESRRLLTVDNPDSSVTELLKDNKKVIKFTNNIYYPNPEQLQLAKYVTATKPELAFVTYRIVREIVTFSELKKFFSDLIHFLTAKHFDFGNLLERIKSIFNKIVKYGLDEYRTIQVVVEEPKVCKCIQQRITMKDKVAKWRREVEIYRNLIRAQNLPCYFQSEFCEPLNK